MERNHRNSVRPDRSAESRAWSVHTGDSRGRFVVAPIFSVRGRKIMRTSFPRTFLLILASLMPRMAAQPQPGTAEKLQHALRLADLYNWADAGPDFAEAESMFLAAGDQRNALYARLGVIRSNSEQHP